jgi:hypothetical protein
MLQDIFPDFVMMNATVITVDPDDTITEAIAVKDGKIIKVGKNEQIKQLIGENTKVMDLQGKTVTPGFIDSHMHNVSYGQRMNTLDTVAELNPTIPDLLNRIKERIASTRKGGWIVGRNIEPNKLAEKRFPTREELDSVSPNNPVYISIRGGHGSLVNSKALELGGITRDTPQPVGGLIEKDPETGEPTGVLREKAAFRRVSTQIPLPTLEEVKEGLIAAGHAYERLGITSTGDAGATDRPESYRAYQEAVQEGKLNVRTYLMIHATPYPNFYRENDLGLRTGFGNERLKMGALKTALDGSIQVFSCAFYEPYVTKNTKGLFQVEPAEFYRIVEEAHKLGYQIAIHVQGDYGIKVAIDAIEYAMWKYPRKDPRHRIEHCLTIREEDLKRMKKLGMIANFYLFHPWYWGDQHINNFIGKERAEKMVPVKTAMRLGVVSCAHSDCPVCTPDDPVWPSNPLWGMWCAVMRKTRSGVDIGPQEKLTPMEALRVYTINGAYASFEEDIKGSIEVGKLADMVVLAENLLTVDHDKIKDIKVEKTIIGGNIVYEA